MHIQRKDRGLILNINCFVEVDISRLKTNNESLRCNPIDSIDSPILIDLSTSARHWRLSGRDDIGEVACYWQASGRDDVKMKM